MRAGHAKISPVLTIFPSIIWKLWAKKGFMATDFRYCLRIFRKKQIRIRAFSRIGSASPTTRNILSILSKMTQNRFDPDMADDVVSPPAVLSSGSKNHKVITLYLG